MGWCPYIKATRNYGPFSTQSADDIRGRRYRRARSFLNVNVHPLQTRHTGALVRNNEFEDQALRRGVDLVDVTVRRQSCK